MAVVAQGPWVGRDGFVAETAVQFDRVNAMLARLEREVEKSREALAGMAEEAERVRRMHAFEETIKNSRDYKITDLQRLCRDIKQRLDLIEGDKSTYVGLTYRSFVAIDRKLAELSALQTQFEQSERNARRYLMMFGVATGTALISLVIHFI